MHSNDEASGRRSREISYNFQNISGRAEQIFWVEFNPAVFIKNSTSRKIVTRVK